MSDKPATSGSFKKGDPRINRKGRPRSFDALRELAQQIGHETAQSNGVELVLFGHKVTVTEAILRDMAMSKDKRLRIAFLEIAYGKVPDKLDVNEDGEIILRVVYANDKDV